MKTLGRVAEKLRWRIADRIDRSSRYCWADLVPWALYGGWDRLYRAASGTRCRTESSTHRDRSCYCAKFENGCRKERPS